jgi:type IV pilus biogenesis protein CpaD/CtpE
MRATRLPIRSVAALAVALLLASCAGLREGRAGRPPDDVVTSTPSPDDPVKPTPLFVHPRDGLVDIQLQQWDRARVIDERTIEVWFYGGVEECYGLARVEVEYRTRSVVITLHSGRVPTAEVCIELAVLKAVRVDLSEPLAGRPVVDGVEQED